MDDIRLFYRVVLDHLEETLPIVYPPRSARPASSGAASTSGPGACIGLLKGSHSPHYDAELGRRPLYQKLIGSGQMKLGDARDLDAGIYFEDNTVERVVSTRAPAGVYYVGGRGGQVIEKVMEPEPIA